MGYYQLIGRAEPIIKQSPGPTRERILEAAKEQLNRVGATRLSLRTVAQCAGYSPAAVSGNFGNRDGLLMALHDEAVAGFRAFISTTDKKETNRSRDPNREIIRFVERYIQFGLTYPHQYELLFTTPLPTLSADPNQMAALDWQWLEQLAGRWITSRGINHLSPELLSVTLWSVAHGWLLRGKHIGKLTACPFDSGQFVQQLDTLLTGLR